jgi:hypothetical protein
VLQYFAQGELSGRKTILGLVTCDIKEKCRVGGGENKPPSLEEGDEVLVQFGGKGFNKTAHPSVMPHYTRIKLGQLSSDGKRDCVFPVGQGLPIGSRVLIKKAGQTDSHFVEATIQRTMAQRSTGSKSLVTEYDIVVDPSPPTSKDDKGCTHWQNNSKRFQSWGFQEEHIYWAEQAILDKKGTPSESQLPPWTPIATIDIAMADADADANADADATDDAGHADPVATSAAEEEKVEGSKGRRISQMEMSSSALGAASDAHTAHRAKNRTGSNAPPAKKQGGSDNRTKASIEAAIANYKDAMIGRPFVLTGLRSTRVRGLTPSMMLAPPQPSTKGGGGPLLLLRHRIDLEVAPDRLRLQGSDEYLFTPGQLDKNLTNPEHEWCFSRLGSTKYDKFRDPVDGTLTFKMVWPSDKDRLAKGHDFMIWKQKPTPVEKATFPIKDFTPLVMPFGTNEDKKRRNVFGGLGLPPPNHPNYENALLINGYKNTTGGQGRCYELGACNLINHIHDSKWRGGVGLPGPCKPDGTEIAVNEVQLWIIPPGTDLEASTDDLCRYTGEELDSTRSVSIPESNDAIEIMLLATPEEDEEAGGDDELALATTAPDEEERGEDEGKSGVEETKGGD